MSVAEELERVIKQAALDGTLTESAVNQFYDLVQEHKELHDEYEISVAARDALRKERDEARTLRDEYGELIKIAGAREADLIIREQGVLKLELSAKYQEMRVKDHKEMMQTIFKPGAMRRELYKSVPVLDQYGNMTQQSENTTETEHDE